jgi:hypothetical protein
MIIPIVHWKIFKPFKYSLKWYFFLNQKTLDLLKFQNELQRWIIILGLFYKTESLNCVNYWIRTISNGISLCSSFVIIINDL